MTNAEAPFFIIFSSVQKPGIFLEFYVSFESLVERGIDVPKKS